MKTELWHPDIDITDIFAKTIIEQQFAALAPVKIKTIGKGWDNYALMLNY